MASVAARTRQTSRRWAVCSAWAMASRASMGSRESRRLFGLGEWAMRLGVGSFCWELWLSPLLVLFLGDLRHPYSKKPIRRWSQTTRRHRVLPVLGRWDGRVLQRFEGHGPQLGASVIITLGVGKLPYFLRVFKSEAAKNVFLLFFLLKKAWLFLFFWFLWCFLLSCVWLFGAPRRRTTLAWWSSGTIEPSWKACRWVVLGGTITAFWLWVSLFFGFLWVIFFALIFCWLFEKTHWWFWYSLVLVYCSCLAFGSLYGKKVVLFGLQMTFAVAASFCSKNKSSRLWVSNQLTKFLRELGCQVFFLQEHV